MRFFSPFCTIQLHQTSSQCSRSYSLKLLLCSHEKPDFTTPLEFSKSRLHSPKFHIYRSRSSCLSPLIRETATSRVTKKALEWRLKVQNDCVCQIRLCCSIRDDIMVNKSSKNQLRVTIEAFLQNHRQAQPMFGVTCKYHESPLRRTFFSLHQQEFLVTVRPARRRRRERN